MENEKEVWAGYVGGLILIIIFGTLALVAAGGWNWFAKFLENSAPAWVQAFGSVFAIFAAVGISNKQHTRQIIKEEEAANQTAKHRNDILYFSIESVRQTCSYIVERAEKLDNPKILDSFKNMYITSRIGLQQFPILEIRNPELALAIIELNQLIIVGEQSFFAIMDSSKRSTGISMVVKKCTNIQNQFWSNLKI